MANADSFGAPWFASEIPAVLRYASLVDISPPVAELIRSAATVALFNVPLAIRPAEAWNPIVATRVLMSP